MNMTILERARSMRIHTGLPKQFWADAINTVVYLINTGPSVPLNCEISRRHELVNRKTRITLRIFSCISYIYYIHIELSHRSKLDTKSRRCIFIGYETDEYGYRLWDLENRKIVKQRMWFSMSRRRTKICRQKRALQRMISEWHLRALLSSRVLRTRNSSNLKMLSRTSLKHSRGEC